MSGVRNRRPFPWLFVAGIVPIVVALARFLPGGVTLESDEAVFSLQVRDAATGGFPTVGLYSRFRWNHPGPAAFYAFAPFHWISGGADWGMLLGAAAWSSASMAAVVWLARRRGRGRAVVALAVAAQVATWIALSGAAPIDPWTPILAASLVLPLMLAAWGATEGDGRAGGALLVLATLVVQLHVGYLVIVAVLAVSVAVAGWDRRLVWRTRQVAIGAAIAVVLWSPVLIDVVLGRSHNVGRLWRYFRRGDPPSAGLSAGARIVAHELAPLPMWLTGPRTVGLFAEAAGAAVWWLVIPIVALGAARASAHAAHDDGAARFVTIAAGGFIAALVAATQLRGIRFNYLVYWRTPIVLTIVLAAAVALRPRLRVNRSVAPVALALGALAIVGASTSALAADQVTRHGDEVRHVLESIVQPPTEPVLVRLADTGFVGTAPATLAWLERHGVEAGVDPSLTWVFGDRGLPPERAATVWYVTDTGWAFSLLTGMPGARVVAERTPLDGEEEAKVRGLHRALAAQLEAAGFVDDTSSLDSPLVALALGSVPKIDTAGLEELAALNERIGAPGTRFGIVAFDAADAPELPWRLAGF